MQTEQTKSFEQTLKDGITQKISAIERNVSVASHNYEDKSDVCRLD